MYMYSCIQVNSKNVTIEPLMLWVYIIIHLVGLILPCTIACDRPIFLATHTLKNVTKRMINVTYTLKIKKRQNPVHFFSFHGVEFKIKNQILKVLSK